MSNPVLHSCQADKDECVLREEELRDQLSQKEQEYLQKVEELSTQLKMYKRIPAKFTGCYTDALQVGKELLRGKRLDDATMTVEKCDMFCWNFRLFGIQKDTSICGNSFQGATTSVRDNECAVHRCKGNTSQNCGGNSRTSIHIRMGFVEE